MTYRDINIAHRFSYAEEIEEQPSVLARIAQGTVNLICDGLEVLAIASFIGVVAIITACIV